MAIERIRVKLADILRQVAEGMLLPEEAGQRIKMPQAVTADEILRQVADWSLTPQEAVKLVMDLHGLPVECPLEVEPVQTVAESQRHVVNLDVQTQPLIEKLAQHDGLNDVSPPDSREDDPIARELESKLPMTKEEILTQVANGTISPDDAHNLRMQHILSEVASGRMTVEEFGKLPLLPVEILRRVAEGKIEPAEAERLEMVARDQSASRRTELQQTQQASCSRENEFDLVIGHAGRACGILFGIFFWLLVAAGVFGFLRSCFVARDTSPYPYDDVPGQYEGGGRKY